MNIVSFAALQKISRMDIYSHGSHIQPGGTYRLTGIIIANVFHAILNTNSIPTRFPNGIDRNSEKKNITNFTGGIRPCENSRTMNWKNY